MAQERNDLNTAGGDGMYDPARHETDKESSSKAISPGADLKAIDDEDRETDEIKERIEETRGQMGETIDAIQEKLSFSNLSEQVSEHVNNAVETAKDAVYGATIGKAATFMKDFGKEISKTSIVKTAKDNPFPFILIGLGAGLLAYQSFSGKQGKPARRQLTDGLRPGERFFNPKANTGAGSKDEAVRGKANGISDTVANVTGTAYDKATSAVDYVVTGVGDAANHAYGKVGDVGAAARGKYDQYIEENPLAVGAVALALGAAVGMAIPATPYEDRMMGEARQELMDKAQNAASDIIDKGKQVVTEAGRAITEKAESAINEANTSETTV